MYSKICIGAVVAVCLIPQVLADTQLKGEISICRRPGFHGLADHQNVQIPISGTAYTYTGTCDKMGENCRDIEVAVTKAGVVAPGVKSCAILPAVLLKGDGQPLKSGQHLLLQWSIPGFEPVITVVQTFR